MRPEPCRGWNESFQVGAQNTGTPCRDPVHWSNVVKKRGPAVIVEPAAQSLTYQWERLLSCVRSCVQFVARLFSIPCIQVSTAFVLVKASSVPTCQILFPPLDVERFCVFIDKST